MHAQMAPQSKAEHVIFASASKLADSLCVVAFSASPVQQGHLKTGPMLLPSYGMLMKHQLPWPMIVVAHPIAS